MKILDNEYNTLSSNLHSISMLFDLYSPLYLHMMIIQIIRVCSVWTNYHYHPYWITNFYYVNIQLNILNVYGCYALTRRITSYLRLWQSNCKYNPSSLLLVFARVSKCFDFILRNAVKRWSTSVICVMNVFTW